MFGRWAEAPWTRRLAAPYVHLVFGARQTGKSTLLRALVPIEVKWTEHPTLADARHLSVFLDEHPRQSDEAFLVCRCSERRALDDRITALPWSAL